MVNLEKNADIIIADHVRKDNPPGSCSYTFIEKSMANGAVENKEDHLAAPKERELRAVGATETRGKSTRIPFTKEDDEYLHRFVMMHPSLSKKGNELYKKLELAVMSLHTLFTSQLKLIILHRTTGTVISHGAIVGSNTLGFILPIYRFRNT